MAKRPDNNGILSWIEEDVSNEFDISSTDVWCDTEHNKTLVRLKTTNLL